MSATGGWTNIGGSRWRPMERLQPLIDHIPPAQFGRYLLVGVWNTAFGYATYAAFVAVLQPRIPAPANYLLASVLSSVINISVAFLGYKWFVFKTKGNYLREWLRCFAVYSSSIALGLVALPVCVHAVGRMTGNPRTAPYIGGALLTGVTVVCSFLGHRFYSFRRRA